MATKMEHLHHDIAHFNNILKYRGYPEWICLRTIQLLLEAGEYQVSTVYENALANIGSHEVVSLNTHDLSDLSDAKLVTTYVCPTGTFQTQIGGTYGKIGKLRVQIRNHITGKFYYFVIPRSAYEHVTEKGKLIISFNRDGSPARKEKGYWKYEVLSFEELSKN